MHVQLSIAATAVTNVTAHPMPKAVSIRRLTPMKGQLPTKK